MDNRKTLVDVFPEWLTDGGIFAALQDFNVPWKTPDISQYLDTEYYGNVSGDKFISPLVQKILTNGELSDTDITLLAHTIFALNGVNWDKEWATLTAEYNPIENYSMTEIMENDETVIEYGKTHTRTDNLSSVRNPNLTETETPNLTETETPNLTETDTPNLTETETPNLTTDNDNAIYGFNSAQAVPTGEQSTSTTGTNTKTNTGTDTKTTTGTDTKTTTGTNTKTTTGSDTVANTGTVSDVDSGDDTHTRNYELTRKGNIGVTTSQQMLESERNLWLWNFFRGVVFPDVDRILTLRIY